ncbi:MAG: radical SAM protein [Cytophagales bacterium]|nr:MAG: radical SAM protein [Cytophagales bacterium]
MKHALQHLAWWQYANTAKIKNAYKLWIAYKRKKFDPSTRPLSLSIEPTTSCNLRCPQCVSGLRSFTRPTGNMKPETAQKVIDQLHPTLLYLTLYFQGEPYLNPQFLDLVTYAHKHKIYTATSTNAHFLTEEKALKTIQSGLDKLVISIDGTEQKTYEQYRIGGKLSKVMQGIQTLAQLKAQLKSKKPYTIAQFIVFKHNEHELKNIHQWAKTLPVDDFQIKTAQVYHYDQDQTYIPTTETQYARYIKKGDTFVLKNRLDNHCWRMWTGSVITWDGSVIPCAFDKDAQHSFGNLHQNTFEQIWASEKYQQFRLQILKNRSEIEICSNCTEGSKVIF